MYSIFEVMLLPLVLKKYKFFVMALGVSLLGYVSFNYLKDFYLQTSTAHHLLVTQSKRFGVDTPGMYWKCFSNATCSNWMIPEMTGAGVGSDLYFMAFILALILAAFPFLVKGKAKIYTARFAEEDELQDISFKDWTRNPRLDFALLLGFYHRLPGYDEQPLRERVLRGEALPELKKDVLAVARGYGGRQELGHMVTTGITRSGKTNSLFALAATWKGSFTALDIKGELHAVTSGYRAQHGPVYVITPEGGGHRFDAIGEIMKLKNGASTAANLIIRPSTYKRPEFAERAAIGLAAIFQASKCLDVKPLELAKDIILGGGLRAFYTKIATLRDEETAALASLFLGTASVPFQAAEEGEPLHLPLSDKQLVAYLASADSDRFLQSAWPMMAIKLKPLLTKEIMWMLSENDFEVSELVESTCSVYLKFPEVSLPITSGVYDLLVQALVYGASSYVDRKREQHGQRWFPAKPMLFALDEAKKAPIDDLEGFLSTAAGRGISVSIYLQSIAQLDALYGNDGAESILSNCNIHNYYKTESLATAKYLSERCHQVSVESKSVSRVRNRLMRPVNESTASKERAVISIEEVMQLGGKERKMFLCFVSGKRPLLLKRIDYWTTPLAKKLAQYPATSVPAMGELGEFVTLDPTTPVPFPTFLPDVEADSLDVDEALSEALDDREEVSEYDLETSTEQVDPSEDDDETDVL
ncbi:hypothetical protein BH24DEI2_BH24DEI2_23050 [soil metagenome]